jgi:hypothetical protein
MEVQLKVFYLEMGQAPTCYSAMVKHFDCQSDNRFELSVGGCE